MPSDDTLRRALHHAASSVAPDTAENLTAVRRKSARREDLARRLRVLSVAAALLLVLGLAWAVHVGTRGSAAPEPVQPPTSASTGSRAAPNPFSVSGRLAAAQLGLSHVLRVAFAPDGNLYVTDRSQQVAEVTPAGRVLQRWGRPGSGPGEFRLDSGAIAVGADGRVYVSDAGNARVQVFSADGRFLRQLGTFGRGKAQFEYPSDVAVDDRGNVYVADDRAATLTKLTPGGAQAWRLGTPEEPDPDLVGHEHFAGFDGSGRLVTANDDAGLVLLLDPDGREVDAFGTPDSGSHENGSAPTGGEFPDGACDATVDATGHVYVTSCQEADNPVHNTEVLDRGHRLVGEWLDGPFAASPRFASDGTAAVVSHDGSILELTVAFH